MGLEHLSQKKKKEKQIERRDCLAWIREGSGGILSVCVNA